MQTYAQFKTSVAAIVQDANSVNFTSAELDTFIPQACREAGRYVPHVVQVSFNVESRQGRATSTSSGNLVDSTASQFLSTDVGKVVYNTYDRTWAVITAYTSATTVALSKDIMAVNEGYRIFNSGCTQPNQIDLSNLDDYLDVERVEYPIGTPRNWSIDGKVMTVKVNYVPNTQIVSGSPSNETEVMVWFKKRHLISQLTDLAGALAGTMGVVGTTSIALSSLQSAGTIETGQEFTISLTRGTYSVTSDATIASNTVVINFYPPLESAVATTTAVNFIGSTLTPTLEPLVAELTAGLASVSKPMSLYQHSFSATTAVGLATTAMTTVAGMISAATTDAAAARTSLLAGTVSIAAMTARLSAATVDIASAIVSLTAGTAAIASMSTGILAAGTATNTSATTYITLANSAVVAATVQIALIDEQIALASSAMTAGYGLLNAIGIGGGAGDYMSQANGDLGVAQGVMANGQTLLQQAAAQLNLASTYYNQANVDLRISSEYAQQSNSYGGNAAQYVNAAHGELSGAREWLSQAAQSHANANGYLNTAGLDLRSAAEKIAESNANLAKAASELAIARSGQTMEGWGRNQLAETRTKLRNLMPTKYMTSKLYPKD